MPDWKQCEGELVGGEFPLERYLGGNERGAVFRTRWAAGRAVVKLVPAGQAQAGDLVERWNGLATLEFPYLVRIFAAGTWAFAGVPLAYVVTEYAEENLAEVLRDRPLSTDEAREMLYPVAEALAYLHGQGLVHGNLKPSNIMAVEDRVKLSSETISPGDPVADIRALGVTLVQALTRRAVTGAENGRDPAVDALPVPFRELVENCLSPDPQLRWSAANINAWLVSPGRPVSSFAAPAAPLPMPAGERPKRWIYVAVIVAIAAALAIAGLVMHRTAAPVAATQIVQPAPAPVQPMPAPALQAPPASDSPPVPTKRDRAARHGIPAGQDGIVRRVLPAIPAKARDTVHGRARVAVRVVVAPSGNVTQATLERGGSPYFGRLALEAARHWQFSPAEGAGPRSWILRFEIMRNGTRVIPVRAGPE